MIHSAEMMSTFQCFCPLKGGFLVENGRSQKTWSCCLSVCLSVRILAEISRKHNHRLQRLYFRLIFGSPKTDPPSWALRVSGACTGVPKISSFFRFLFTQNAPALRSSSAKLGCIYPSQFAGFSIRKPHFRGRTAPRVQTSKICGKFLTYRFLFHGGCLVLQKDVSQVSNQGHIFKQNCMVAALW